MTTFIVNTPYHKEWWLPDRSHRMISTILGDKLYFRVIRESSRLSILSGSIDLKNPQWEDLWETAQELANKRFRDDRIRKDRP